MEYLVQLRQKAESQNKVIDVSRTNLTTGARARIVAKPTRGDKVVDGIFLACCTEWLEQVKPLF